ncbi:MAG TPA: NAD(P)-dependent oxidoreductase, partial [Polyangiales bacterium]|nr:NAD(P)-dependent oxidoreductase [Polyangiales bacterium]
MSEKIAFIGLGVMGGSMAAHLARAGHEVAVFNRTLAKAQRFVEQHGGRAAESPADAARGASVVFSCVGNDEHLAAVTIGPEGAFETLSSGAVFVDHTTCSANLARELARHALRLGFGFLDAPVTGGQIGAEQGTLSIMIGGGEADFERVKPLLAAYAKHVRLLGPAGSGQLAKMVNQICIAGLVQALAEGLAFAEMAGLDPAAVVDVISRGAAQSWQMEQRHKAMIENKFEFGFAVDWMRKDLGLALDPMPIHSVTALGPSQAGAQPRDQARGVPALAAHRLHVGVELIDQRGH